jgi:hypothetical protein
MKKLFTIIIVLLMIFTLTIGCTSSGNGPDEDNIYIEEEIPKTPTTLPGDDQPPGDTPQEELLEEDDAQEGRTFNVASGEHGYLAMGFIQHMNDVLPFRLPFTTRELESANWIVDTLLDMGFDQSQIEVQTFRYDVQTSSWWGNAMWAMEWFAEQGYFDGLERIDYSQNVILTIPGRSQETIVIGAHYDTVNNPGISDNAAGVALLLESAYRMQNKDHYYTLQYIFFGAEEVGLIGAFYFVDSLSATEVYNLALMINADVIIEGPIFVYALGYVYQLPEWPMEILWGGGQIPTIYHCSLTMAIDDFANALIYDDIHLVAIPEAIFSPSDHLAFIEFGIPILYFYGTYPPQYPELFVRNILHTPDDNLDFIMADAPGRIEEGLRTFGRFLDAILMME